jgi:hypothetical protein
MENMEMRITDDRYTRDRLRLDLAIRMIRHEARTGTIRRWTGLSADRVRKLYRTYVEREGPTPVKRHRGSTPRQVRFFLRNRETRRQAAQLAGLFTQLGLLAAPVLDRGASAAQPLRLMQLGELFCCAYETYQSFERPGRISFEHACYLLHALQRRAELRVGECPSCQALVLVDALKLKRRRCTFCEIDPMLGGGRAPREAGTQHAH